MNTKNVKKLAADWHPLDEDLLMSLDGELEAKEAQAIRLHLNSCWSCRSRSEKMQAGISAFIDYHENVLTPLVKNSPQNWTDFGNRLQKAATAPEQKNSWLRILANRFNSLQLKFDNPAIIRSAIAGVLVVAILSAFLFFGREQNVSASEILEKSLETQKIETDSIFQPIVYQKTLVTKSVANAQTETLTLESWNDKLRFRNRMALAENNERKFITEKIAFGKKAKGEFAETLAPSVLLELQEILQKNQMDSVQPLSANSFANWRKNVILQNETIEKSLNADGAEILTIRANVAAPIAKDLIKTAELIVRMRDWHPVKLAFEIEGDELRRFEFVETNFEIVSLANLNPNILPPVETLTAGSEKPQTVASPAESPAKVENVEIPANTNSALKEIKTAGERIEKPIAATTEQELEVLQILQNANADLGEQITVERGADGKIYVNGIVENAERKAELLSKLNRVADGKIIKVNIQTVNEALARQKQIKQPQQTPTPEELAVTVDDETQNFAPELRQSFASDEAIRRYSSQMVSRSRQTMSHAFALRNLINQFKAEKSQNLSPEAREKLLALIKTRANSFQSEAANLRGDLQKVFAKSASGARTTINSDAELFKAVERLFGIASANDRAIRSAFAAGAENSIAALRSAQFWQSLADAETLAESIAAAK